MEKEKFKVWECRLVVRGDADLPRAFDGVPREAAWQAVERAGVRVEACFSGWGGKISEREVAVIENREPDRAQLKLERDQFNALELGATVLREALVKIIKANQLHSCVSPFVYENASTESLIAAETALDESHAGAELLERLRHAEQACVWMEKQGYASPEVRAALQSWRLAGGDGNISKATAAASRDPAAKLYDELRKTKKRLDEAVLTLVGVKKDTENGLIRFRDLLGHGLVSFRDLIGHTEEAGEVCTDTCLRCELDRRASGAGGK